MLTAAALAVEGSAIKQPAPRTTQRAAHAPTRDAGEHTRAHTHTRTHTHTHTHTRARAHRQTCTRAGLGIAQEKQCAMLEQERDKLTRDLGRLRKSTASESSVRPEALSLRACTRTHAQKTRTRARTHTPTRARARAKSAHTRGNVDRRERGRMALEGLGWRTEAAGLRGHDLGGLCACTHSVRARRKTHTHECGGRGLMGLGCAVGGQGSAGLLPGTAARHRPVPGADVPWLCSRRARRRRRNRPQARRRGCGSACARRCAAPTPHVVPRHRHVRPTVAKRMRRFRTVRPSPCSPQWRA